MQSSIYIGVPTASDDGISSNVDLSAQEQEIFEKARKF